MIVKIYRHNVVTLELNRQNAVLTRKLMAEHELVFTVSSPIVLDIAVGDYLTYKGDIMTVNNEPDYTKISSREHRYTITFQGIRHSLERIILKDEGSLNFSYRGTLDEYMFMFLECLHAFDPDWSIGELEEVEPFSLSFDKVYCWDALNDIAEGAGCEWQITGKEISIKKTVGTARALTLAYGKGNGLYSLGRKRLENSRIVTRAYAFGGTQNLPQSYAFTELTLPGYLDDEVAIELYGLREGYITDTDIFPSRTGTVTGVAQVNDIRFSVSDAGIDFDLDGQRIDGTDAKIVFTSGLLNGEEFKILSYNHATKTIHYEANTDANGNVSPSGFRVAELGDKYIVTGIRLPESYVNEALNKLSVKREEYLNSNKVPRVVYELDLDILNLKRLNTELHEGDIVRVVDEGIGLDAEIRVTSVSYPANFPDVLEQGMKFTAEIGNEVTYTRIQKVEKDIKETKQVVTQVTKTSIENDRRNVQALAEFTTKIFDPDGNMQEPLIQAIAAFYGTQSMLYDLDGVTYVVNVSDDPNAFEISGGRLIHKTYKIDGLGYTWNLVPFSVSGLDPIKPYYLSARCSKTALTGEWSLTTDQKDTDSEVGYWHFNLGILSSVIEGERSLKSTKGYTVIAGGEIVTDSITAYHINVNKLFAQLITVGSDGYVNAGISGLSDQGSVSQRFWAGATEANRHSAPFQVLNDGSLKASKGAVGGFTINSDSLKIGTDDTWEVAGASVFLMRDYFLQRANGSVRGQRREASWNLYRDASRAASYSIYNTVATADPLFPFINIALELSAENGNDNYALYVHNGISRFKASAWGIQRITGGGQTISDDVSRVLVSPDVVAGNLYLPQYPVAEQEITIKNLSGNDFVLVSNNGSIIQGDGTPTFNNSFRRYAVKTFLFDGSYWIEMHQISDY
ncbi:hypothetical protein [Sphingobacterium sp. LRF_L2]|uniref:hypothetical protein n=1 Tax=Sphingobacterium sp. LRF_L2 TaxID=3369421 RepID=UPI003F608EF5